MKMLKYKDDIPELCDFLEQDPLSEREIENAFDQEYKYKCQDRRANANGKIDHRSVMLICYGIYADLISQAEEKVKGLDQLD